MSVLLLLSQPSDGVTWFWTGWSHWLMWLNHITLYYSVYIEHTEDLNNQVISKSSRERIILWRKIKIWLPHFALELSLWKINPALVVLPNTNDGLLKVFVMKYFCTAIKEPTGEFQKAWCSDLIKQAFMFSDRTGLDGRINH